MTVLWCDHPSQLVLHMAEHAGCRTPDYLPCLTDFTNVQPHF